MHCHCVHLNINLLSSIGKKSLKESVCMIIDNSIVSRQDVLHRPSVNQMTFPVSIIIRQKIYILLANIRHRQVFSPHHRMFVRGKIQIKFGTDASPVTRLIGQVFFLNLSDHCRQLWTFLSFTPSQMETLEIIVNLISIWDRGLRSQMLGVSTR